MPPSFGNRDDNSITANPCGTKKKTAAINHISNDPKPNFAVVPRCLRPRTATRLKRTRSRSFSARTRCGLVCVVSVFIKPQRRDKNKLQRIKLEMIDQMNRQFLNGDAQSVAPGRGAIQNKSGSPERILGARIANAST